MTRLVSNLSVMSKSDCEIETARRFLIERQLGFSDLKPLKEFNGRDGCPDVVAVFESGPIGIELTAYSPNESINQLAGSMFRVYENGVKLADNYPNLRGVIIRYSPNKDNVLRERDCRAFARELLEFATGVYMLHQFRDGESRRFPGFDSGHLSATFQNHKLLPAHVIAVFVEFHASMIESPVFISPDGIATHFGTSSEVLCNAIMRKKKRLLNAQRDGFHEIWLLIHATGNPRSSRITLIQQSEIQPLLAEPLCKRARDSGFDHVFVWDGVRGGSVDLINGDIHEVAPQ